MELSLCLALEIYWKGVRGLCIPYYEGKKDKV